MNNDVDKVSKKIKKVALIILISFVIVLLIVGGISFYFMLPVSPQNNESVSFVVETGSGKNKIVSNLEKQGLIKSSLFAKIMIKLSYKGEFLAGSYNLSKSMSLTDILDSLSSGENVESNDTSISFIEGKRFTDFLDILNTKFSFSKEDVINITTDKEYLTELINKYWFLTDDILKDGVYYPLEGYLFPDTYFVKKDATIKEVIEVFLNGMDKKLVPYKEYIESNNLNITSLLTLASVIELEASSESDRKEISGVFQNRLKNNISIGSDVTTYYALKKELGTPLTQSDINSCNAYNTRGNCTGNIPIGPICNPSIMSIDAAIYPSSNEYFYFVADSKGKVYYSKTASEHASTVAELKSKGLWS